jgi:hypothetical protein
MIRLPLPATPVVLVVTARLPFVGFDEVTVGPAAAVHAAPGKIEPAGAPTAVPELPATPPPPPLPHPATKPAKINTVNNRK